MYIYKDDESICYLNEVEKSIQLVIILCTSDEQFSFSGCITYSIQYFDRIDDTDNKYNSK